MKKTHWTTRKLYQEVYYIVILRVLFNRFNENAIYLTKFSFYWPYKISLISLAHASRQMMD